jgi:hypothetical protein
VALDLAALAVAALAEEDLVAVAVKMAVKMVAVEDAVTVESESQNLTKRQLVLDALLV